MGKLRKVTGYRIHVEPRQLGDYGWCSVGSSSVTKDHEDFLRQTKKRCEEIARDIKRHVDNVSWVETQEEVENVCEHCGHGWTEDSPNYNGGCCEKDEENNPIQNEELVR